MIDFREITFECTGVDEAECPRFGCYRYLACTSCSQDMLFRYRYSVFGRVLGRVIKGSVVNFRMITSEN